MYVSRRRSVALTISSSSIRAFALELDMQNVRREERVGGAGAVMSLQKLVAAAACVAALAACAPNTALMVRFPLGNVQRGREAFISLECNSCHRIQDVQLTTQDTPSAYDIPLGGHTPRIETYGDIITAIVNPSHRLARSYRAEAGRGGPSPMTAEYLNDVMTTQQLVDIAAFLHTEYDYIPPPPPPYWEAYPGGDTDPFDWNP